MDHRWFSLRLGRLWSVAGDGRRTRLSWVRFAQLARMARRVRRAKVPGAFAEFGVWRGGCLYLVSSLWRGSGREVHGFDSFEGLPEPDRERDGSALRRGQFGDTSLEDVRRFLEAHGHSDVRLHPGWFHETIEELPERLALVHLDADLYDSVKLVLEHAYERLSPGGILIVDDYGHPNASGATIAVEEFFADRPEAVRREPGVDYSAWVRRIG